MSPTPEPIGPIASLEPGRRGEILDAALAVFAEKGYAGGSMREIAARVGFTEPALYRHFASKEALFLTLVQIIATHLRDEALDILRGVQAASLRADIAAALASRRERVAMAMPMLRTVLPAAAHQPAILAEVRAIVFEPLLGELEAKVADLDAAFGMQSDFDSRRSRVRAFLAMFAGSIATSVMLGDEPDETIADAIVRLMGWEGKA